MSLVKLLQKLKQQFLLRPIWSRAALLKVLKDEDEKDIEKYLDTQPHNPPFIFTLIHIFVFVMTE